MMTHPAFRLRAYAHAVLSALFVMATGHAIAGPEGGQVVGGSGTISQSGLNTTINQTTQNMAINWQSYNVNVDERVQYIQPNSSAISLNRILSNNGSTIAGRIDANGQVILVNSNGVFFTPTASINVGGIIASTLDIAPTDFMNGNYIFNEVLGTDGAVVNSGMINASLGGNVALIGKQVQNDGLIVANLGTVTLAAGKQAVLTFDQGGLLGVRVSKEILQEELGVDPAVMNSGEIKAEGGRVLLTASTSQDVFSQAVNTGDIEQATSVVVHEDGSFTLGGGADVVNTGSIDTSTTSSEQPAGRIVLLGENVTNSGELRADVANGNGGEIELHAQDKTLLTENSVTSARSEANGQGGIVKVLGDKVGLFDQATVDVTGANGGGQALIGGDYQGKNSRVRNATSTIVNGGANIYADAITHGDGGRVILWSDGNTFFGGDIFVRGGALSGDGGFIETSGKENLYFRGNTNRQAPNGQHGVLLLDPRNITIGTSSSDNSELDDRTVNFSDCNGNGCSPSSDDFSISASKVQSELNSGNVLLQANQDIIVNNSITTTSSTAYTLRLEAGDDITINEGASLSLGNDNLVLIAGSAGCSSNCQESNPVNDPLYGGNIRIQGTIDTSGSLTFHAADDIWIDNAIGGTTAPSSITLRAGGSIETRTNESPSPDTFGTLTSNGAITLVAADSTLTTDLLYPTNGPSKPVNGNIILQHDVTTNGGNFTATTTAGYFDNWFTDQNLNAENGNVTITANGNINDGNNIPTGAFLGDITTTGTGSLRVTTTTGQIRQSTDPSRNLEIAGSASFNAGANRIDLQNNTNNLQGTISLITTGNNNVDMNNAATTTVLGTTVQGALSVGGALTVNADQNLTLANNITVVGTTQLNFGQDNNGRTFTATPGIAINTGSITVTGGTGADIFNLGANITGIVDGGSGDDIFNITAAGLALTDVRGGGGTNTLTAHDSANTWTINTTNGGALVNGGQTINFTQMQNLTGGANDDTFIFGTSGSVTGLVNGGGQISQDSANLSALAAVTVDLANLTGFTGIEHYIGNGTNSTLIGENNANTWAVTSVNTGSVDGVSFVNFNNLTGGNAADIFNLGANVTGIIDGGSGNDTFNITATGLALTDVRGGGGTNTITGHGSANAWTINTANGGTLVNGGQTINFTQMQNLTGGANDDTFTFGVSGSISGLVSGGGQVTQDTVNLSALTVVSVNLASPTGYSGIEHYIGNSTNSTLTGENNANTWTISGTNTGAVDGVSFVGFNNLVGGTAGDRFEMGLSGSVASIDGGSASNNVLVARQGVVNTWTFTGAESGSLAQAGSTYVSAFSNIQSFVGGGVGGEWANLSALSSVNVQNYFGFAGIIGSGSATLVGQDGQTNTWIIQSVLDELGMSTDGINDGTFTNANGSTSFINFANLQGGNGIDNFTIDITGSITGEIRGGDTANINTLTGRNADSTWTITANNAGYIDTTAVVPVRYVQGFTDIQQINGGAGVDAFNLTGGIVDGIINGGSNIDSMTISVGGDQIIELGNLNNANLNVYQVESITANSATNNTIIANSGVAQNDWNLTGARNGTVFDGFTPTVSFANFDRVQGGTTVDNFTLSAGNFAGVIDGGTGADTLLITASGNRVIELGDRVNANLNVFRVETITANAGTDNTLLGDSNAAVNTWTISAARGGAVSGGGNTTVFGNINNVGGGTTTDNFTSSTGSFTGLIDGGAGTDTLIITATGDRVIELGNRVNANQNVYRVETITANAAANNTLISDGNAATNTWAINAARGGTVTDSITTTAFSNIDNVTGGVTTDNFTLSVGNFAGLIDGGAGADTLTITAAGDRVIELGNRVNSNQNMYRIETLIANAGAVNELVADSAEINSNNWTISGANSGRVISGSNNTDFSNINHLTGTSVADTFTISGDAASGVSGVIDGMDGPGVDTLTITATGDRTVELGDRVNANVNVHRVETITARAANTNVLIADSNAAINTWAVTGNRSGSVSDGLNSTNFNNFDTLTGGSTVDRFTVSMLGAVTTINGGDGNDDVLITGTAGPHVETVNLGLGDDVFLITGGQIIGAVNGGDGSDNITVSGGSVGSITMGAGDDFFVITGGAVLGDVNGDSGDDTFTNSGGTISGTMSGDDGTDFIVDTRAVVDITLGVNAGGFEGITAQNNNGTLRARAGQTTNWTIDADNAGDVVDSTESLAFVGFSTLVGGNGTDNFNVTNNGSISGLISGSGGADTLSINLAGRTLPLGIINFDGGGNTGDAVMITGPAGIFNETYSVNQTVTGLGSFDRLTYTSTTANLDVNFRAVESVTDNVQVNTLTLNSASALNTIQLGTNMFGAANSTSVAVSYAAASKQNITVNALNGADVEIGGNVTLPGTLTLVADTVSELSGASITANTLNLQNSGMAGTAGNGLNTDVVNLQLNNTGAVYIDEQNDLNLAGMNSSALVEINAGGNVSDSADLISTAALTIRTAGDIVLDSVNNLLSGVLTFTGPSLVTPATGNITLVNGAATTFAGVNAQSLNVTSAGDITDTGTITVAGVTTLNSGGDIILDGANDFGSNVNVGNVATAGAANLTLNDVNSINVGIMNTTNSVNLTVADQIIDGNGGAINIISNELIMRAVNGITLGGQNSIGTQVSRLDAINTSTPAALNNPTVAISNTGQLTVANLQNDGDVLLYNDNNIIIDPVPQVQGGPRGAISSNYQGGVDESVYAGDVTIFISGSNGSISALGNIDTTAPEIIAENLTVIIPGTFGSQSRLMHLSVHDTFFLSAQPPGYVVYYGGRRPIETGPTSLVVFSSLTGLSGQQLIEIESLGDVDPAIFTEVRNYFHEDVAILLPADQRLVDDEEEEKKRQQRQNEVN